MNPAPSMLFLVDKEDCRNSHETGEIILFEKLNNLLSGVPPPPSLITCRLTHREMLQKYRDNVNFFTLPPIQEELNFWDLNPKVYNLNNGPVSEEIASLMLKVQARYVQCETLSTCTSWFESSLPLTASAKKKKQAFNGLSPGRRLSHLARRRQAFSRANLQQLSQNDVINQKLAIKTTLPNPCLKNFIDTRKVQRPDLPKRALFQSPEEDPVRPGFRTIVRHLPRRKLFGSGEQKKQPLHPPNGNGRYDVSGWIATQNFNGGIKRMRTESRKSDSKRRCTRRSLDFSDSSPSHCSEASTNYSSSLPPLSDIHKQKLLWAVSFALKERNITHKSTVFKSCASSLFSICRKNLSAIKNLPGGTSEKMLCFARQEVTAVIEKLENKAGVLTDINDLFSHNQKSTLQEKAVSCGKDNIKIAVTPEKAVATRHWRSCIKSQRKLKRHLTRSCECLLTEIEKGRHLVSTPNVDNHCPTFPSIRQVIRKLYADDETTCNNSNNLGLGCDSSIVLNACNSEKNVEKMIGINIVDGFIETVGSASNISKMTTDFKALCPRKAGLCDVAGRILECTEQKSDDEAVISGSMEDDQLIPFPSLLYRKDEHEAVEKPITKTVPDDLSKKQCLSEHTMFDMDLSQLNLASKRKLSLSPRDALHQSNSSISLDADEVIYDTMKAGYNAMINEDTDILPPTYLTEGLQIEANYHGATDLSVNDNHDTMKTGGNIVPESSYATNTSNSDGNSYGTNIGDSQNLALRRKLSISPVDLKAERLESHSSDAIELLTTGDVGGDMDDNRDNLVPEPNYHNSAAIDDATLYCTDLLQSLDSKLIRHDAHPNSVIDLFGSVNVGCDILNKMVTLKTAPESSFKKGDELNCSPSSQYSCKSPNVEATKMDQVAERNDSVEAVAAAVSGTDKFNADAFLLDGFTFAKANPNGEPAEVGGMLTSTPLQTVINSKPAWKAELGPGLTVKLRLSKEWGIVGRVTPLDTPETSSEHFSFDDSAIEKTVQSLVSSSCVSDGINSKLGDKTETSTESYCLMEIRDRMAIEKSLFNEPSDEVASSISCSLSNGACTSSSGQNNSSSEIGVGVEVLSKLVDSSSSGCNDAEVGEHLLNIRGTEHGELSFSVNLANHSCTSALQLSAPSYDGKTDFDSNNPGPITPTVADFDSDDDLPLTVLSAKKQRSSNSVAANLLLKDNPTTFKAFDDGRRVIQRKQALKPCIPPLGLTSSAKKDNSPLVPSAKKKCIVHTILPDIEHIKHLDKKQIIASNVFEPCAPVINQCNAVLDSKLGQHMELNFNLSCVRVSANGISNEEKTDAIDSSAMKNNDALPELSTIKSEVDYLMNNDTDDDTLDENMPLSEVLNSLKGPETLQLNSTAVENSFKIEESCTQSEDEGKAYADQGKLKTSSAESSEGNLTLTIKSKNSLSNLTINQDVSLSSTYTSQDHTVPSSGINSNGHNYFGRDSFVGIECSHPTNKTHEAVINYPVKTEKRIFTSYHDDSSSSIDENVPLNELLLKLDLLRNSNYLPIENITDLMIHGNLSCESDDCYEDNMPLSIIAENSNSMSCVDIKLDNNSMEIYEEKVNLSGTSCENNGEEKQCSNKELNLESFAEEKSCHGAESDEFYEVNVPLNKIADSSNSLSCVDIKLDNNSMDIYEEKVNLNWTSCENHGKEDRGNNNELDFVSFAEEKSSYGAESDEFSEANVPLSLIAKSSKSCVDIKLDNNSIEIYEEKVNLNRTFCENHGKEKQSHNNELDLVSLAEENSSHGFSEVNVPLGIIAESSNSSRYIDIKSDKDSRVLYDKSVKSNLSPYKNYGEEKQDSNKEVDLVSLVEGKSGTESDDFYEDNVHLSVTAVNSNSLSCVDIKSNNNSMEIYDENVNSNLCENSGGEKQDSNIELNLVSFTVDKGYHGTDSLCSGDLTHSSSTVDAGNNVTAAPVFDKGYYCSGNLACHERDIDSSLDCPIDLSINAAKNSKDVRGSQNTSPINNSPSTEKSTPSSSNGVTDSCGSSGRKQKLTFESYKARRKVNTLYKDSSSEASYAIEKPKRVYYIKCKSKKYKKHIRHSSYNSSPNYDTDEDNEYSSDFRSDIPSDEIEAREEKSSDIDVNRSGNKPAASDETNSDASVTDSVEGVKDHRLFTEDFSAAIAETSSICVNGVPVDQETYEFFTKKTKEVLDAVACISGVVEEQIKYEFTNCTDENLRKQNLNKLARIHMESFRLRRTIERNPDCLIHSAISRRSQ